jgi:DNA-binding transcriptional LysR family regulator
MNRARFDLNLLRVFHAVYTTRNVRRSAELLKQSQPAVSHSLTRLRLHLKDPLFLRAPGGVAPTARADHFATFVEAALRTIDVALVETERFDPLQSGRRFVMHMSDLAEGEFLPGLMRHLDRHAPKVRIETIQLAADGVLPEILARTDLAAIIPHRPATRFARAYALHIAEPDLGLAPLRVELHWTWRMHNDPGHRWLRETFASLFGERAAGRTPASGR